MASFISCKDQRDSMVFARWFVYNIVSRRSTIEFLNSIYKHNILLVITTGVTLPGDTFIVYTVSVFNEFKTEIQKLKN